MSRLASKFIKSCVVQNLKTRGESFSSLDITVSNQLDDDDLSVGILINHLLDDGSISESQVDKFYDSVRAFYERAYEYCILDDFVKYCGFVDFFRRNEVPWSYIEKYLAFPSHIHETVVNDPGVLQLV